MSAPIRSTTKSTLALVAVALEIARRGLASYSCPKSRHDFTQAQLFAILVLRQFLRADYRKMTSMLTEWSDLRQALGLAKVPHFTTLQKAEDRLLKKTPSAASWTASFNTLGHAVGSALAVTAPSTLPALNPDTSVATS
jgi:hypothetical protein